MFSARSTVILFLTLLIVSAQSAYASLDESAVTSPYDIPGGPDSEGVSDVCTVAGTAGTAEPVDGLDSLPDECITGDLPAGLNAAPTRPVLIYPVGVQDVSTDMLFSWKESTDPDGDHVTYRICYAPYRQSLDDNCYDVPEEESILGSSGAAFYAGLGSGVGLLLLGMAFSGGGLRRRAAALTAVVVVASGLFLLSCDNETVETLREVRTYSAVLEPDTPYTWKVIASDGVLTSESETGAFTTGGI